MRQKSSPPLTSAERLVRDIGRATRKQYSAEEKIRIVLDGRRGEVSVIELCRRKGIAESLYYRWSNEFLEGGKRHLAGGTARSATTSEVKDLKRQVLELKEVVAGQAAAQHLFCCISLQMALLDVLRQRAMTVGFGPIASKFAACAVDGRKRRHSGIRLNAAQARL